MSMEYNKTDEFKDGAMDLVDESRRTFLKLLGGTAALAGLSGCNIRKPYHKIVPYSRKLEHVVPGKPTFYATSFNIDDAVYGSLVETHEGRPTKIEGNPVYPGSKGASLVLQQAEVLNLYDPDRIKNFTFLAKLTSFEAYKDFMLNQRAAFRSSGGKGVALLIEHQLSPTFYRILSELTSKYPEMKVYRHRAVHNDAQLEGLYQITGKRVQPVYDIKRANVIVSFSDDFLGEGPGQLAAIDDFSSRRDPDLKKSMNRLYVFEDRVTVTGSKADHRFPVRQVDQLAILSQILIYVAGKTGVDLSSVIDFDGSLVKSDKIDSKKIEIIADDLLNNRGRSLVTVGRYRDSVEHKICFLLNNILGNQEKTVHYATIPYSDYKVNQRSVHQSMEELVEELDSGNVESLFVLGGNPIYSASSYNLSKSFPKAKHRIHLTDRINETSKLCDWVIPRLHFLEAWGDLRSHLGVESLVQPVIKRTVEGLSDTEFINLLGSSYKSDYTLIKATHRLGAKAFEKALHNGYLREVNTAVSVSAKYGFRLSHKKRSAESIEISFYPDYKVYDGRYSNNTWLQELPDPISKLTWDNAAYISPKFARRMNLKSGDVVEVSSGGRVLEVPVFESPGHVDSSLSVSLGFGKLVGGRVEESVGFNAANILSLKDGYSVNGVTLIKTKKTHLFATTQDHGSMEGRPHHRSATLRDYKKKKDFAQHMVEVPHQKSLWNPHDYSKGYQWGMVIDLSKCTSCNVCITSCQAENNIPSVGKKEVANGREMHWMRLDRYYIGDEENPEIVSQPVTCLHCENAPCEQVCPVAATVHDNEGLNVMVYNRCVGTRYCSDNCPAKVRRFNFFDYHQRNPHATKKERFHLFDYMKEPNKSLAQQFNPDVTVRMRGIMEKCTYCIQRIKGATQKASNENRVINDGEVVTACQQACPANAIVMGNILDEKSKVARLRKKKRNYSILEQLLLNARTTYLAEVVNPNPRLELQVKKKESHGHHQG